MAYLISMNIDLTNLAVCQAFKKLLNFPSYSIFKAKLFLHTVFKDGGISEYRRNVEGTLIGTSQVFGTGQFRVYLWKGSMAIATEHVVASTQLTTAVLPGVALARTVPSQFALQ